MDRSNQTPRNLFQRIRSHRLSATFALLTVLSGGILIGSVLTRSVSGKEQTVDSSDARPLVVPSPVFQSNEFSKIAKAVGPAVVNINTITLPKHSAKGKSRTFHAQPVPNPNGGDDDQGGKAAAGGDMQDFFNRFYGGQWWLAVTTKFRRWWRRSARRSAPASSRRSRADTSSPTTTWSTRPTRYTSSSPPILTMASSMAVPLA